MLSKHAGRHEVGTFFRGGLAELALHSALSAPVSVALTGAREVEYVDMMRELAARGPWPAEVAREVFEAVHLLQQSNAA